MGKTLYDLQVGDEVIVATHCSEYIVKVQRLTNNYVVAENSRYRKSDGLLAGSDKLYQKYIYAATPEDIARIHEKHLHNRLARTVSDIPFQSLTNGQLQSILDIARQAQPSP